MKCNSFKYYFCTINKGKNLPWLPQISIKIGSNKTTLQSKWPTWHWKSTSLSCIFLYCRCTNSLRMQGSACPRAPCPFHSRVEKNMTRHNWLAHFILAKEESSFSVHVWLCVNQKNCFGEESNPVYVNLNNIESIKSRVYRRSARSLTSCN